MRTSRFHTRLPLHSGETLLLDEKLSHYMLRVLRLQSGDRVILFGGDGREFQATLHGREKQLAKVEIHGFRQPGRESSLHVRLGQGLSRGERMDFVMQKSVELGVNRLSPLFTQRSEVRLNNARLEKKHHHWEAVVCSACEQSGRVHVPLVDYPLGLKDWCADKPQDVLGLVLDPDTDTRLGELEVRQHVWLLIGPEGGLDDEELALAEHRGFSRIGLGPRVLRTETAALAALAALQTLWGDLAGADRR